MDQDAGQTGATLKAGSREVASLLAIRAVAFGTEAKETRGGTTRDGVLDVQGDRAELVLALLLAEGHQAKRASA